jgi:hypothetical protein
VKKWLGWQFNKQWGAGSASASAVIIVNMSSLFVTVRNGSLRTSYARSDIILVIFTQELFEIEMCQCNVREIPPQSLWAP